MNVATVRSIPSCPDAGRYIYHKAEKIYGKAYQVFINIYGAYTIAKDLFYLPPVVHNISKTVGYIGVVDLFFAGPRLITNITGLMQAGSLYNSLHDTVTALLEVTNVLSLATEVFDLCKDIGFISQGAYSWTDHLHYAFLPSQVIMLGQSVEHAVAVVKLRHNISLQYINEHAQDIQQSLSLSKKCRLKEHSKYLLEVNKPDESQAFMDTLKTRIHIHCSLAIIDVLSTIASSILSAASLIAPTTPLMVALYTATCVASLAYAILEALLVRRTLQVVEVKGGAHDAVDTCAFLHKLAEFVHWHKA